MIGEARSQPEHLKPVMFENLVSIQNIDTSSESYRDMLVRLGEQFSFMQSEGNKDITRGADFLALHGITKRFYAAHCPDIFENYVPLYHSLWKLRVRDALDVENIHQDGGVHHFSNNGYDSRMITIWTNLYKDAVPGLSASDLGIYIIDNTQSSNRDLYEQMALENAHFREKRRGQLIDNMHIGGKIIRFDASRLTQTHFDYREGVSIRFNSHLLHGSKRLGGPAERFSADELDRFRVSLTTVWLHEDDVNWVAVNMPEHEHEQLYLSKIDPANRDAVRSVFASACADENQRLIEIKKLIREHLRDRRGSAAAP